MTKFFKYAAGAAGLVAMLTLSGCCGFPHFGPGHGGYGGGMGYSDSGGRR